MKSVRYALLGLYINLFLIIGLVISFFYALDNNTFGNWLQWLLIVLVVITDVLNVIFAIINIMNSCRLYKSRDYNLLRKYMRNLKLGSIPYFVLNFVLYLFIFLFLFAASRGIVLFSPIPLFIFVPVIFFTYLEVLFTSSYGLGFLVLLKRENRIKHRSLIIHVFLQLCFVLDIISTLILLLKFRKNKREGGGFEGSLDDNE